MREAYLEYPEARAGMVGIQQPISDHVHLQVRRGPCESRGKPERLGASRWEKTGIVLLGSESNQLAFCAADVTAQVRDLCYLLSRTQVPNYPKRHWAD